MRAATWRKNNPIPSDQSRWGRFNELADYNRQFLHNILEKDAANNPKRSPVEQKIGDMYASCMDEATVNKKGSAPLKPELDRIAAITTKDQLVDTIAYLQSLGVQAVFNFGASPDLHNASMQIANIAQGGLGLAGSRLLLRYRCQVPGNTREISGARGQNVCVAGR